MELHHPARLIPELILARALREGTQRQITDLAQAEIEHWPEENRQLVAPIIANYSGTAPPLPRDRVPGPEFT